MAGPGRPKTGGRKPGSLNKRTLEVHEILEKLEFNLVEECVALYKRTSLEEYTGGVAAKCLDILFSRVYPKKGEMKLTGDLTQNLNIHGSVNLSQFSDEQAFVLAQKLIQKRLEAARTLGMIDVSGHLSSEGEQTRERNDSSED